MRQPSLIAATPEYDETREHLFRRELESYLLEMISTIDDISFGNSSASSLSTKRSSYGPPIGPFSMTGPSIRATGSTTTRTLSDRFAEVANVKDYGAKGDGVADDTAAIQAAIDYASLTTVGEKGMTVFFPEGKYRHAALQVEANNVWLRGASGGDSTRLIKTTTSGWGITFGDGSGLKAGLGLVNLSFGQEGTAVSGGAILLNKTSSMVLTNVTVFKFPAEHFVGIRIQNGSFRTEMTDCEVTECLDDGIQIVDSLGTGMYRVRSDSNVNRGILADAAQGLFAVTISMFGNTIACRIENTSADQYNSQDHWWVNAAFDSSKDHNCDIVRLKNSSFVGCGFAGSQNSTNSSAAGVRIVDSSGTKSDVHSVRFVGCLICCNQLHGAELDDCRSIIFSGCDIHTNGDVTLSGSAGISLDKCETMTITGNHLTFQQEYGIAFTGTASTRICVTGNNLEGNANASFLETTRPTDSQFGNNITIGDSQPAVASTSALTLTAWSDFIDVTGTSDITSMTGGSLVGRVVRLHFTGTAATNGVVDGSNLKLSGNFAYTPDDILTLIFDGTNWIEISRSAN